MATDTYGRNIGDMPTGWFEKALGSSVKSIMQVNAPNDAPINRLYEAINELANKRDPDARKENLDAKKWTERLVEFSKSFTGKRGDKKPSDKIKSESQKPEIKYLSKISEATNKLWIASQQQNTIWVGISKFSSRAQKQIANAIKMSGCCAALSKATSAGMSGPAGMTGTTIITKSIAGGKGATRPPSRTISTVDDDSDGGGGGGARPSKGMAALSATLGLATVLLNKLGQLAASTVNATNLNFSQIIPSIPDANAYVESLRQILHQQIGFVQNNNALEQSFRQVATEARAAGVSLVETQRFWLRNLQRGLLLENRSNAARILAASRLRSVQTTALATAQSLDMNLETTNEMFMNWHYHLALSANDIAMMGRHMQTVSRNTGLTGKELEKAMTNADRLVKSFRDAGLASTTALRGVTQASASAQRHGVGEEMTNIMAAMSSSSGYMAANPSLRAFLTRAAGNRVGQLTAGQIPQDPEAMRDMASGMEREIRNFLRQTAGGYFASRGVDVNTLDLRELNSHLQTMAQEGIRGNLEAQNAQRTMDLLAPRVLGIPIGAIQGLVRTNREANMSPGQRLQETIAERDRVGAMDNGRGRGTEQFRQLNRQVTEAQATATLNAFTELQRATRTTNLSNLDAGARENLNRRLNEELGPGRAEGFLSDLNQSASQMMQTITARAQAVNLNLGNLVREQNYSNIQELQANLARGGEAGELALQALNSINTRIQTQERRAADPATEMRGQLQDANTYLQDILTELRAHLGPTEIAIGVWGGNIVAAIGPVVTALATLALAWRGLGLVGSAGRWLVGGGGAAAAAASAAPAAAAAASAARGGLPWATPVTPPGGTAPNGLPWATPVTPGTTPRAPGAATPHPTGTPTPRAPGRAGRIARGAGRAGLALAAIGSAYWLYNRFTGSGTPQTGTQPNTQPNTIIPPGGTNLGYGENVIPVWVVGGAGIAGGAGGTGIGGTGPSTTTPPSSPPPPASTTTPATEDAPTALESTADALGTASDVAMGAMALQTAGQLGTRGVRGAVNLVRPAQAALTAASTGTEVATTAARSTGLLARVGGYGSRALGIAGRALGPLDMALGAVTGAMDEEAGGTATSRGIFGALTGSARTNSEGTISGMISDSLGFQQGSVEERQIATLGAAARGAMIGSIAGPAGAAVGAIVGAGAEIYKGIDESNRQVEEMRQRNVTFDAGHERHMQASLERAQQIQRPQDQVAELERLLETRRITRGGISSNLTREQRERANVTNWFGINPEARALNAAIESSQRQLQSTDAAIAALESQLAEARRAATANTTSTANLEEGQTEANQALQVTAQTMQAGQTPGSIYVHDTHCEAILNSILEIIRGRGEANMTLQGAFEENQASEAIEAVIGSNARATTENGMPVFDKVVADTLAKLLARQEETSEASKNMTSSLSSIVTKQNSSTTSNNIEESIQRSNSMFSRIGRVVGSVQRNEGLFNSESNIVEAVSSGITDSVQRTISNDLSQSVASQIGRVVEAAQRSEGIFNRESNITEAMSSGVSEAIQRTVANDLNQHVSSAIDTRAEERVSNIVAEVSDVLNYERQASEAAENTRTSELMRRMESGEISSTMMDYRDDLRGEVNTSIMNRFGAQTAIERERYGEQASGIQNLASMDQIADYLVTTQAHSLQEMVSLLGDIKDRMTGSPSNSSTIIGRIGDGVPASTRPGIKNISRDTTRGFWDLNFGDESPGAVMTEGRGGSA